GDELVAVEDVIHAAFERAVLAVAAEAVRLENSLGLARQGGAVVSAGSRRRSQSAEKDQSDASGPGQEPHGTLPRKTGIPDKTLPQRTISGGETHQGGSEPHARYNRLRVPRKGKTNHRRTAFVRRRAGPHTLVCGGDPFPRSRPGEECQYPANPSDFQQFQPSARPLLSSPSVSDRGRIVRRVSLESRSPPHEHGNDETVRDPHRGGHHV